MRTNPSERFWAKVDRRGDCWEWTASRFRNRQGQPTYGTFNDGTKNRHAHRYLWEVTYGPIPDGLMVLHSCDNPPCVRLTHLSLGTHRRNMDEMVQRLRHTHGTRHHSHRLTEDQAREIKRRLSAGEEIGPLSRQYGVTWAAIYLIAVGKNWSWLDAA